MPAVQIRWIDVEVAGPLGAVSAAPDGHGDEGIRAAVRVLDVLHGHGVGNLIVRTGQSGIIIDELVGLRVKAQGVIELPDVLRPGEIVGGEIPVPVGVYVGGEAGHLQAERGLSQVRVIAEAVLLTIEVVVVVVELPSPGLPGAAHEMELRRAPGEVGLQQGVRVRQDGEVPVLQDVGPGVQSVGPGLGVGGTPEDALTVEEVVHLHVVGHPVADAAGPGQRGAAGAKGEVLIGVLAGGPGVYHQPLQGAGGVLGRAGADAVEVDRLLVGAETVWDADASQYQAVVHQGVIVTGADAADGDGAGAFRAGVQIDIELCDAVADGAAGGNAIDAEGTGQLPEGPVHRHGDGAVLDEALRSAVEIAEGNARQALARPKGIGILVGVAEGDVQVADGAHVAFKERPPQVIDGVAVAVQHAAGEEPSGEGAGVVTVSVIDDVLLGGVDVVHQEVVIPMALFQVCHGIDGHIVIGDDVGVRLDGGIRGRGLGGDLGGIPVLQDAGPGGQGVARSARENAALVDGVIGVAGVVMGDDVLIGDVIGHTAVLGPCHRAGPGLEGGGEVVLVLAEDLRLIHGKGRVHAAGRVRGQVGDPRKADVVRLASRGVEMPRHQAVVDEGVFAAGPGNAARPHAGEIARGRRDVHLQVRDAVPDGAAVDLRDAADVEALLILPVDAHGDVAILDGALVDLRDPEVLDLMGIDGPPKVREMQAVGIRVVNGDIQVADRAVIVAPDAGFQVVDGVAVALKDHV